MAHLVVFQPDARVEARLSDALRPRHEVSTVASWPELSTFVVRETVDGCVMDADHPTREEALAHIRQLRKRHPGLALVTYADVDPSDLDLYHFGGLGVDGVVLARRPPWAATIRDAMEHALASARASRVRSNLEGRFSPEEFEPWRGRWSTRATASRSRRSPLPWGTPPGASARCFGPPACRPPTDSCCGAVSCSPEPS